MRKENVTVVYDRKKTVAKTGNGKVDVIIYLGNGIRKYVTIHSCNPFEWKEYQRSQELREQLAIYKHVVETMVKKGDEMKIIVKNPILVCSLLQGCGWAVSGQ